MNRTEDTIAMFAARRFTLSSTPLRLLTLALVASSMLVSCTGETRPLEAREDVPSSTKSRFITVKAPDDPTLVELPARVVASPTARAEVASVYVARVVAVHVRPGDRVKAGDVVAEVVAPEVVEAHARLGASRKQITLQKDRSGHLSDLEQRKLVGRREVFEVDARLAELDAERRVAAAKLAAAGIERGPTGADLAGDRLRLRAPIDGVVVEVDAVLGEVRDPTDGPLLRLASEQAARIEVRAQSAFPKASSLRFVSADAREVDLKVEPVASVVDPVDGSARVWFDPETPTSLPEGLRGHVEAGEALEGALQVPQRALRWQAGVFVVYRRRAGDGNADPIPVPVDVVARSGSSAIVTPQTPGELANGDEVAADARAYAPRGEDE
jgi:cobalt-zinc-cadmium efflux system membrane fusion protein